MATAPTVARVMVASIPATLVGDFVGCAGLATIVLVAFAGDYLGEYARLFMPAACGCPVLSAGAAFLGGLLIRRMGPKYSVKGAAGLGFLLCLGAYFVEAAALFFVH